MSEKIEVATPFGMLIAEAGGNPDYPGIHIYLSDGIEERQLVLAESPPCIFEGETRVLRLLAWAYDSNDYSDDYSHEFIIRHERPEEGGSQCQN